MSESTVFKVIAAGAFLLFVAALIGVATALGLVEPAPAVQLGLEIPAGLCIGGGWIALEVLWHRRRRVGDERGRHPQIAGKRRQASEEGTRPRQGALVHSTGERIPLRFVPTDDADTFLAVTVDGERVTPGPGDSMEVDVIGPGQGIVIDRG